MAKRSDVTAKHNKKLVALYAQLSTTKRADIAKRCRKEIRKIKYECPDILKAKVIRAVKDCVKRAEILYSKRFPKLAVKFGGRSAAGSAHYSKNMVKFHPMLLKEHTEEMLKDVVPHEVAHMVEYWMYNAHGHSARWQRICRQLGGCGDRKHTMSLENRRIK